MPMKLYSIASRDGVVRPEIVAALGLPRHIQQVEIYLVAPTKRSAAELADATPGIPHPSGESFRVATCNTAEAITAAIFVTPGVGHPSTLGRPVMQVHRDGSTTLVGQLDGWGAGGTRLLATDAEARRLR